MTGSKRLNGSKRTKPYYFVRRSAIHGRGVFAARKIPKGTQVIEYKGQRVTHKEVDRRYANVPETDSHTFLFELDDKLVIDAGVRGNAARWINHGCKPNCETVEDDGRIFIEATRDIARGEELTYDYNITLEERHTPRMKQIWACLCGARRCRGTILAKKR
ncbi:MAG: SET domain-containing protein [Gammaproteobacteria bacterium]|nr:SET domain-containing protein [Gammaproteobacteria bacterium]